MKFISILFTLFFIFSLHAEEEQKECEELLHFKFDDRDWKNAFEDSNESASIMEFTLTNENINNWTELVTVQKLPAIQGTPKDYYQKFIEVLSKNVEPAKVESKVIHETPDSIFFEWWINDDKTLDQHEWFKFFDTKRSSWILRYTTKNVDDLDKVRSIWEKNLDAASIELRGNCKDHVLSLENSKRIPIHSYKSI